MSVLPAESQVLDGYRLIRFLGRGGFGEVWLCQSEAMGGYHALKFIPERNSELLEKEYQSLALYRKEAAKLRSPHLVPIEHINRNISGLYYVMPLADGYGDTDPANQAWFPLSLAAFIESRAHAETWYSIEEITSILQPILQALQTLSDAGLVHRDVKPENILFFNGLPCLGDISLLGADSAMVTRRGTPGYATPSWYLGGHPDMYGAAATIYSLLTGNSPDKMGRAAFLWPPQGEASLNGEARAEWLRLHSVIRRATDERVSERYVDFSTMARALTVDEPKPVVHPSPPPPPAVTSKKRRKFSKVIAGLIAVMVLAILLSALTQPSVTPDSPGEVVEPNLTASPERPITSLSTQAFENAGASHASLSALDPHGELFSNEENEIYQDAIIRIGSAVQDESNANIPLAIRHLDQLIQAIPKLEKIPNVELARLLFRQSAGEAAEVSERINDPHFVEKLKDDNLYGMSWRVNLLCLLNTPDLAELYLRNVISAGGPIKEQCAAFLARAKLKAARDEFAGAKSDSDTAKRMAQGVATLEQSTRADLMELEAKNPAYANYLKSLPEK